MNKKQLIKKIQEEPVYHIEDIQGSKLWGKQKDIANSVKHFKKTTVRSCNGAGKSFTSARIVLWFLTSFKNSIVITTAPTFRQVQDILWREIRDAYNNSKYDLGGTLFKVRLEVSDRWYAIGLSTDQPDKFQGYHAEDILIVVDEAAGVSDDIIDAIEGNLTSERSRLLFIGNPTNLSGEFYKSHRSQQYNKIHISAFDTPNFTTFGITLDDVVNNTWRDKITGPLPFPHLVTPEWVYDKLIKWGFESPMFQARVLGNFPQQGDDTLIPLIKIEEATRREVEVFEDSKENTGIDVARFGVDKTIFIHRKGMKTMDIEEHTKQDTMETTGQAHVYLGKRPFSSANVDVVGVGAGVFDRLVELNPYREIFGINTGVPSSNPDMFFNLRAELGWMLRELFMNDSISIPADDELMAQLSNIKYKFNSKGQIIIESKEEMKRRSLPSPDKADALALAYYEGRVKDALLDYMKQVANGN